MRKSRFLRSDIPKWHGWLIGISVLAFLGGVGALFCQDVALTGSFQDLAALRSKEVENLRAIIIEQEKQIVALSADHEDRIKALEEKQKAAQSQGSVSNGIEIVPHFFFRPDTGSDDLTNFPRFHPQSGTNLTTPL